LSYTVTRRHWKDFNSHLELRKHFVALSRAVRSEALDIGRAHYALSLAVGVWEAISCGCNEIAAVEMGVAGGVGLLSLCQAAAFYNDTMGMDIRVYGFDNATGLPVVDGHRDHPELWNEGEFSMQNPGRLLRKLPPFAELILGDIADTVAGFEATLRQRKLAFVSIDVDLYSSTKACFSMLEWAPECYLPVVPFYFDDMEEYLTYNDWCGEELAIREFNEAHPMRKFQRHPRFNIRHFFGLHVLDHKIRTGEEKPVFPLRIGGI
jgi:hypothetical protein